MTVTTGDQPDTSTEDRSDRERVIRDLYSLAAFYVAHPDHPLPEVINVHHYIDDPDQVARIAAEYSDNPATERADGACQTHHFLERAHADVCMIVIARAAGR